MYGILIETDYNDSYKFHANRDGSLITGDETKIKQEFANLLKTYPLKKLKIVGIVNSTICVSIGEK